jgi:AcrR family transcriptional regulator
MGQSGEGLRERTRRAVQSELMTVAMTLFLERGYERTTVEQIALAAGVSRRSFFRYFESKEDVLAVAFADTGAGIAEALRGRPSGESAWLALRRSFDLLVADIDTEPRTLQLARIMLESPALRPGQERKRSTWTGALADALEPRLRAGAERSLRAAALGGAALACLATAQSAWVEDEGRTPFGVLLDAAMAAVAPLA